MIVHLPIQDPPHVALQHALKRRVKSSTLKSLSSPNPDRLIDNPKLSPIQIRINNFGNGQKSPHFIRCGHVFCFECVTSLSPAECPLCRSSFAMGTWQKLHVDMSLVVPSNGDAEACRLQDELTRIAGSEPTETSVQRLVDECQEFLEGRPNSMYKGLRTACQLASHLCNVKEHSRSQDAQVESLEDRILQLIAEREEVAARVEGLEEQIIQLVKDRSDLQDKLASSENTCQTLLEYFSSGQAVMLSRI
ncbi:hypothetical protein APHAL10511_007644 [Amanita phalloides]|nr:hypothetical protein APHAL10511_007644 [Amanita phalloides]